MPDSPTPEKNASEEPVLVQKALEGKRVTIVGRSSGMSKRDARRLVREHGGTYVDRLGPDVDLIVLGEGSIRCAE